MKKLLCLFSMLAMLAAAGQAGAYSLSFQPATQTVEFGAPVIVDVLLGLGAGEEVWGFDFQVGFDSTVLSFGSVTFVDPVLTDFTPDFNYEPGIDPNVLAWNGISFTNPLTNGTFSLGSISFFTAGWGTSPLNLAGQLETLDGALLDVIASGSITAVPEPGTAALLLMGVIGLVGARRKAGTT